MYHNHVACCRCFFLCSLIWFIPSIIWLLVYFTYLTYVCQRHTTHTLHKHNNRQPQFLSNPSSTRTQAFVIGMNKCKKKRIGISKAPDYKGPGLSKHLHFSPHQEISFNSFFFISLPSSPLHRGMEGRDGQATIIQSQIREKHLSIKTPKQIAQTRVSHQPWHKSHTGQEAPHCD